jgi:hypothetical protein
MMIWKGFGRKLSWPNFKPLSQHSSGGTQEDYLNLSQESRSLGLDLNPGPPEYEAVMLLLAPSQEVALRNFGNVEGFKKLSW